ncbi:MAG: pinensin family lanthipeptide [Acidobacteriota bacterium]|nr:pinensin family lanthipeptide [Acidobacteriota bacterium]
MKLKLKDIEVKSFVTKENSVTGGALAPFTKIPCSAIDACPSAWICPVTQPQPCFFTGPGCA